MSVGVLQLENTFFFALRIIMAQPLRVLCLSLRPDDGFFFRVGVQLMHEKREWLSPSPCAHCFSLSAAIRSLM